MSKFLSRAEVYRILQRELPEGVYPDGAPEQYVSTADNDSVAQVVASSYSTMESVADNLLLISADAEKMGAWETTVLGESATEALDLEERRRLVIAKLRSSDDISLWQIVNTVASSLADTDYFEIRQRNVEDDWFGRDIKGALADEVWGSTWIADDPAPSGVTVTDLLRQDQSALYAVRTHVYTYDVVIFSTADYTNLVTSLDRLLTDIEPARSAHTVNLIPTVDDFIDGTQATRFNYTGMNGYVLRKDETADFGLRLASWYFGFEDDPSALEFAESEGTSTYGGHWWYSFES